MRPFWASLLSAVMIAGQMVRVEAQQLPIAVIHASQSLLFDVGRTLIPRSVVQTGSLVARTLEARYCGASAPNVGRFLVALEVPDGKEASTRELLANDCSTDLTKVAARLVNGRHIDGLMMLEGTWSPWQIILNARKIVSVGNRFSERQLALLRQFSENVSTKDQILDFGDTTPYHTDIALEFQQSGMTACMFSVGTSAPACNWAKLNGDASVAAGANSTLLIGHELLKDLINKYRKNMDFQIASGFTVVVTSYGYDKATATANLLLMVTHEASGKSVSARVQLAPADLSVIDVVVNNQMTANCGSNPSADCAAGVTFLEILVKTAITSQKRPLEAKAVDKDLQLKVLDRVIKFILQSRRIFLTCDYLVGDLEVVVDQVE